MAQVHHVGGELTLPASAVSRLEPYFYFGDLPIWGPEAPMGRIVQKEWGPVINVVWSFWESAEACAFLRVPETQSDKTWGNKSPCAKALNHLANTACIRATGQWCNGELATPSEQQWAEGAYPFPMQEEVVGTHGKMLAICNGLMTYKNK